MDELGRFEIAIPDSTATLVASGMGYQSKEFKASANNRKVELQLQPAAASLSEVVVSGYSSLKKNVESNEIDTSEASPAGGWKNFERANVMCSSLGRNSWYSYHSSRNFTLLRSHH